jgi:hypothetical protein
VKPEIVATYNGNHFTVNILSIILLAVIGILSIILLGVLGVLRHVRNKSKHVHSLPVDIPFITDVLKLNGISEFAYSSAYDTRSRQDLEDLSLQASSFRSFNPPYLPQQPVKSIAESRGSLQPQEEPAFEKGPVQGSSRQTSELFFISTDKLMPVDLPKSVKKLVEPQIDIHPPAAYKDPRGFGKKDSGNEEKDGYGSETELVKQMVEVTEAIGATV